MSGKILILGDGQLGSAFAALLGPRAIIFSYREVDFLDRDFLEKLESLIKGERIDAIINAAAYTQVDKAEGEGSTDAMRINGEAVGDLAAWCKARHLPLVHYSTDYVLDGSGEAPKREDAPTGPLNTYGQSKLAGERALAACGGKYLLFRTSWVYDAQGKNFFNTILRLMGEKESLNVVADQVGAPTYAPHLAKASWQALEKALAAREFPSGLYHLCAAGETSWQGFAQAILTLARSMDSGQKSPILCQRINPIPTSEYPLPARRPLNSRLDCSKALDILGVSLPRWEDGCKECFSVWKSKIAKSQG